MPFFVSAIILLWTLVVAKYALFWLYLWQLKEYHIGRFLDHFKTHKGEKLLFGTIPIIKVVLLLLLVIHYNLFYFYIVFYALFAIYSIETLKLLRDITRNTVKKPVITFKTILLTIVSFAVIISYALLSTIAIKDIIWFTFGLLLFDILIPVIISIVVLFFQPFFVLARNNILKKAANKIALFPNLTVIGITGSYGKTATKEFLTTILSSKFKVLATPEHKNSEMGIAHTIIHSLNNTHQIFVVEMGSYNKGGIKLLCDMVRPRIGIVTGVNEQHLSTFGSLENLLSAEGGRELVSCLPKNGLIVLNADNAYCLDLYKKIYSLAGGSFRKKLYTLEKNKIQSDIWTEEIVTEKDKVSFMAMSREKELAHITVDVLGKQQVQNVLGAILVAKEMGMNFEEISQACNNIVPAQAGMTVATGIQGMQVIDSSYSSNPNGVIADLDYLNIYHGKKVVIMPCLIELGAKSAEIHHHIGKKIAQVCDLVIVTTADKFEELKIGAMESGMAESQILLCDKPTEIIDYLKKSCNEGDAVLLEGRVPSEVIKLLKLSSL